jgi:hypothetical protein
MPTRHADLVARTHTSTLQPWDTLMYSKIYNSIWKDYMCLPGLPIINGMMMFCSRRPSNVSSSYRQGSGVRVTRRVRATPSPPIIMRKDFKLWPKPWVRVRVWVNCSLFVSVHWSLVVLLFRHAPMAGLPKTLVAIRLDMLTIARHVLQMCS